MMFRSINHPHLLLYLPSSLFIYTYYYPNCILIDFVIYFPMFVLLGHFHRIL